MLREGVIRLPMRSEMSETKTLAAPSARDEGTQFHSCKMSSETTCHGAVDVSTR